MPESTIASLQSDFFYSKSVFMVNYAVLYSYCSHSVQDIVMELGTVVVDAQNNINYGVASVPVPGLNILLLEYRYQ